MMKSFKLVIVGLATLLSVAFMFTPATVSAVDCNKDPKTDGCPCAPKLSDGVTNNPAANSAVCKEIVEPPGEKTTNTFRNIVNLLLAGAGIIAIITIIISAIRFISSRGDSNAVTKARQTLIYSVAGLVITALAFAIVNFVFSQLG